MDEKHPRLLRKTRLQGKQAHIKPENIKHLAGKAILFKNLKEKTLFLNIKISTGILWQKGKFCIHFKEKMRWFKRISDPFSYPPRC